MTNTFYSRKKIDNLLLRTNMTHAEGNTDVQIVLISVAVELFHCGKETFRDLMEQFHEPINPTSPVRDGNKKKKKDI